MVLAHDVLMHSEQRACMRCRWPRGRFLLHSALVLLMYQPVFASWVTVEKDYLDPGLRTVYVDPDTISREGKSVTVSQLTDYKVMQGNVGFGPFMMSPHRFYSTTTRKHIDCEAKRVRLLSYTEFLRHMATGPASNGYVDTDRWIPIEPETINYALWELVCVNE